MSQSNSTQRLISEYDLHVRIGRLERKLEKVKKQRDHFKELYQHYAKVIELQPYIERRWEDYEKRKQRELYHKGLEQRVKEQALLIEALRKEIDNANPKQVD